ncbi:MAG TPA: hypothetical protein VF339_16585 [Gammaproteobacteria bacterium]
MGRLTENSGREGIVAKTNWCQQKELGSEPFSRSPFVGCRTIGPTGALLANDKALATLPVSMVALASMFTRRSEPLFPRTWGQSPFFWVEQAGFEKNWG